MWSVDMTVLAAMEPRSLDSPATNPELSEGESDRRDEEQAFAASSSAPFAIGRRTSGSDETELQTRASTAVGSSSNFIKRKTSQLLEAISPGTRPSDAPISPKLAELVENFNTSDIYAALRAEIQRVEVQEDDANALPDVALENNLTRGRRRASWGTQFQILSGRAFKNLYRDPALLTAHYVAAIVVARESLVLPLLEKFSFSSSHLRCPVLPLGQRHPGIPEQAGCILLHVGPFRILLPIKPQSLRQREALVHA